MSSNKGAPKTRDHSRPFKPNYQKLPRHQSHHRQRPCCCSTSPRFAEGYCTRLCGTRSTLSTRPVRLGSLLGRGGKALRCRYGTTHHDCCCKVPSADRRLVVRLRTCSWGKIGVGSIVGPCGCCGGIGRCVSNCNIYRGKHQHSAQVLITVQYAHAMCSKSCIKPSWQKQREAERGRA